jgi:serine/threonine-protein kinase HipA
VKGSGQAVIDEADVLLGDAVIGELRCERGPDQIVFRFLPEYMACSPRPVLGQQFENDLPREHRSNVRVPAWFSHLLPEGPLRQILADYAHVSPAREFYLLGRLGEDLPGAVRVRPRGEWAPPHMPREPDAAAESDELRFSLAGLQLKFSAKMQQDGLTIPARGEGGDWIVKLPGDLPDLPENEAAMLDWAHAADIDAPEHRIVGIQQIARLPFEYSKEGNALAVRRYDRTPEGRIHQEDFAQVLEKPTGDNGKYEGNYETLGAIVLARAGLDDFRALVRRLVFAVLSNNGDAHLKNWSLIYTDGVHPRLAPAYDLVFVGAYEGHGRRLALKIGGTRRFEEVRPSTFHAFAQRVLSRVTAILSAPPPLNPAEVETWAREDAARILDAWATLRVSLPLSDTARARLEAHLARMPLARPG